MDQDRLQLRDLLLEGASSAPTAPVNETYFDSLRERVRGTTKRPERSKVAEPWSALVLDEEWVIHETTPIQPAGEGGYRDTPLLTYRHGGFLGSATFTPRGTAGMGLGHGSRAPAPGRR